MIAAKRDASSFLMDHPHGDGPLAARMYRSGAAAPKEECVE